MLSIKRRSTAAHQKQTNHTWTCLKATTSHPIVSLQTKSPTAWWFFNFIKKKSELNWDHYPRSELLTQNSRANGFDNFQPLWKVVGIIIESSLFILVVPKKHQQHLNMSKPPGIVETFTTRHDVAPGLHLEMLHSPTTAPGMDLSSRAWLLTTWCPKWRSVTGSPDD
jgi:hypothetical protein